jgi:hypothetical protein
MLCVEYSIYAVLRITSCSEHGEIERDELTSSFQVMGEWKTRK